MIQIQGVGMKAIDILLCQPRHVSYEWFRYNLSWISKYGNTLIALTQDTMPPDLTEYITQVSEYREVRWVKPPKSNGTSDWRDLAVNDMIRNFSKAEYILFLEQDFLMTEEFLKKVVASLDNYDWIYYLEGDRIHPAFSLLKRENALKSSMDFAVQPTYDHFYNFFMTLPYENKIELKELGFKEFEDYSHLAGFTQEFHTYKLGQPFYKPEVFLAYNYYCNRLPLTKIPFFSTVCEEIEKKYGKGDVEGYIKSFFPKE